MSDNTPETTPENSAGKIPLERVVSCVMWGYYNIKKKKLFHVYANEHQVRMCCPGGFKREEKEGIGRVVELLVTESN